MTRPAHLTAMAHLTVRSCRDASIGRCRMRASVLAPAAVKDYPDLSQPTTGDTTPL